MRLLETGEYMPFKSFVDEAGLRALAMARLSQCEYSVMLYLLNCSASGFSELVTTEKELSTSIRYDIKTIKEAMESLSHRGMVLVKHPENVTLQLTNHKSIRIGIQYDMAKWQFDFDHNFSAKEAVVFPFMRGKNLQIILGTQEGSTATAAIDKALPTWRRVLLSFAEAHELTPKKLLKAESEAKLLVQIYPVDQILLFLRHFGARIPTLSLLASSWQHYEELFETETHKVDLLGAKQKHLEFDNKVRENALHFLESRDDQELSEEEVAVLDTLANHNHPRRQLFWAYQTRGRYPKLRDFFRENKKYMLPVTSNGSIIKRKLHQD